MPTLVTTPDEITASWLTEVLRGSGALGDGTVTDVGRRRIGAGRLGATYLLTPTYEGAPDGVPPRVVAKLPATDEGGRRWAASLNCYRREVAFYTELAAGLAIRTPRCHHAAVSEDGTGFCLILEDLTPAAECGQVAGCDPDRAAAALEQAAALHAGSWRDERLRDREWLTTGISIWHAMSGSMPTAQKVFRDRYGDLLGDATVRVAERFADGVGAAWVDRISEPRCLWHCDFRLDNLLFEARGGEVPLAVVDWQSVVLANGTVDASYFVGAGLPTGVRREHEEELVRGYHEALRDRGVGDYPWSTCWAEYRINSLAGFIVAVAAAVETERSPEADAMFTTMANRHAAHIEDHDAFALLED
jgi:hypothetical protein